MWVFPRFAPQTFQTETWLYCFCFSYSDLLISAPYHGQDQGRVYVYINNGNVSRFELLDFFLYYIFFPKAFTKKCIEMIFPNPSFRIHNKIVETLFYFAVHFWKFFFFWSTGNLVSTTRLFVFLPGHHFVRWGKRGGPSLDQCIPMPPFSHCLISSAHNGDMEFEQPRRLRQIKRHLKINICAMVAIL